MPYQNILILRSAARRVSKDARRRYWRREGEFGAHDYFFALSISSKTSFAVRKASTAAGTPQ